MTKEQITHDDFKTSLMEIVWCIRKLSEKIQCGEWESSKIFDPTLKSWKDFKVFTSISWKYRLENLQVLSENLI